MGSWHWGRGRMQQRWSLQRAAQHRCVSAATGSAAHQALLHAPRSVATCMSFTCQTLASHHSGWSVVRNVRKLQRSSLQAASDSTWPVLILCACCPVQVVGKPQPSFFQLALDDLQVSITGWLACAAAWDSMTCRCCRLAHTATQATQSQWHNCHTHTTD